MPYLGPKRGPTSQKNMAQLPDVVRVGFRVWGLRPWIWAFVLTTDNQKHKWPVAQRKDRHLIPPLGHDKKI